jgi:hypothetical protein
MPIADLLRQSVTLLRTTSHERDSIGGATVDATTSTTVLGYLEPRSSSEDLLDRNTQIGDWLLVLPAGTDVIGWDRVTSGGRTFDILGPPRGYYDVSAGTEDHFELDLREVV